MRFLPRPPTAVQPAGPRPAQAPAAQPAQWGPLLRARVELDIHFARRSNRAALAVGFPLLMAAQLLVQALPGPVTLQVAPLVVGLWGLTYLVKPQFWQRRRMRRLPACAGLDLNDAPVRIVGTLEPETPGAGFHVPGGTRPALYARTFYRRARADGAADFFIREEIRGVPLVLRRADGVAFRIDPASILLLEAAREADVSEVTRRALAAPTRGLRQQIRQVSLCAGDSVEAVGRIAREASADGAGAPGRGTPMVQRLLPSWENAVWIHRLAPAPALPPSTPELTPTSPDPTGA